MTIVPVEKLPTDPAYELRVIDDEVKAKVEQMLMLMYKHKGVGLAAPQVGWNVRLFVCDVATKSSQPWVFINPTVVLGRGVIRSREGCLSAPGKFVDVVRAAKVEVSYTNLSGTKKGATFDGLLARVVQHEFDHLQGLTMFSRSGR